MNFAESFRDKIFVVVDSDARIRRDDDLMAFVPAAGGGFQAIPKGTKVQIVEVKVAEAGSRSSIVLVARRRSTNPGPRLDLLQPILWGSL